MILDVYIGDLDDETFDFQNGDYNGNIPKQISENFPNSHESFWFVIKQITENHIYGKQTDWAGWVAIVYPCDVRDIFIKFYNESDFNSLEKIIKGLDENKKYGLVARELW